MDFTGVALGSGVNQYMKMDEMARQNRALKVQEDAAAMAKEKGQMELDQMRQVNEIGNKYRAINSAAARGDLSDPAIQGFVSDFNSQKGAFNDNHTMSFGTDAKGGRVINFHNGDNELVGSQPMTRENLNRMIGDAYKAELSYTAPEYYFKNQQNDVLQSHYGRPTYMQDGTGRIIGIDTNGNQIGTYGTSRPQATGGGGAQMGQLVGATDDRTGLVYNTPNGLVTRPLPKGVSADSLFPKATGQKPQLSPEDNEKYRQAVLAIGPRPAATTGWFGGAGNQKALDAWDANKSNIDQVYGVAPQSNGVPAIKAHGEDPIAASKAKPTSAEPSKTEEPKEEQPKHRGLRPHRSVLPPYGAPYQSVTYDQVVPQR